MSGRADGWEGVGRRPKFTFWLTFFFFFFFFFLKTASIMPLDVFLVAFCFIWMCYVFVFFVVFFCFCFFFLCFFFFFFFFFFCTASIVFNSFSGCPSTFGFLSFCTFICFEYLCECLQLLQEVRAMFPLSKTSLSPAGTKRWNNVDSAPRHWINIESTLFQRCMPARKSAHTSPNTCFNGCCRTNRVWNN